MDSPRESAITATAAAPVSEMAVQRTVLTSAGMFRSKPLSWRSRMRQAPTSRSRRFRAERARRSFPGLRGIVFLNAASMGIASSQALAAIEDQVRLLKVGPRSRRWARFVERFERGVAEARHEATRLLGAQPDEVGLIS